MRLQIESVSDLSLISIEALSELSLEIDFNQLFSDLVVQVSVVPEEFVGEVFNVFDFLSCQLEIYVCYLKADFDKS